MTVINDTRVVRLQRVAARTGHQHSLDERIVEQVTDEIVTAADVVALPPGSLITLQRGPGTAHTEEGSVLNAAANDIGGVAGGQTSSVTFDSEDAGVTAAAIFATEIDYSLTLSAAGEYAVNYKTFQIKTYTAVPTAVGSRTLITYTWAPIREYLEWDPENLDPDLVAFGVGPHQGGGGSGGDSYVEAGCNVHVDARDDGYKIISLDIQSLAGEGLVVDPTAGCPELRVDIDAYQVGYDDSGNTYIFADNVQDAIREIDGYLTRGRVRHIRKLGSEADNSPFNSVFGLDGYEYPLDEDRVMLFINGVAQFMPVDFSERSVSTIETSEPRDRNDVLDILILPGSLGIGTSTTNLQNAYDNSPSGGKNISLNDGQLTFTQTLSTGSALRLISSGSVTPTLVADQGGSGEAARLKSVDPSVASLLIQKDTAARNSMVNTIITERTTSHVLGGLTGIGSAFLTRLENSGTTLFSASRIVTGTESATDSVEKTYLALELSDDGVLTEHARLTSTGSFGLGVTVPDATMHVQGDGYFSQGLEVAGQITAHNSPLAPLNVPILADVPTSLKNGDIWISEIGGTRKINVRIGGVTYSVEIT